MKYAHINENGKILGWYSTDIHGENIPPSSIEVSDEIWQLAVNMNANYYVNDEFINQNQLQINEKNIAKFQLNLSIKLESGVYQRRMSAEQQAEFVLWQDLLLEFIKNERQDLPPTPEFINQLLEEL